MTTSPPTHGGARRGAGGTVHTIRLTRPNARRIRALLKERKVPYGAAAVAAYVNEQLSK